MISTYTHGSVRSAPIDVHEISTRRRVNARSSFAPLRDLPIDLTGAPTTGHPAIRCHGGRCCPARPERRTGVGSAGRGALNRFVEQLRRLHEVAGSPSLNTLTALTADMARP